jgi:hypothetical protein
MNTPIFDTITSAANPVFSIQAPPTNGTGSNITFYTGQSEMLKVASDGFYVRGKKLDIDDKEAEKVYRALRQFLIWSALTRE